MPNTVTIFPLLRRPQTWVIAALFSGVGPALAQTAMVQPYLPAAQPSGVNSWLPSFHYVPGAEQADPDEDIKRRPPAQQAVIRSDQAGQYLDAARSGVLLMRQGPVDDKLRLMIANSLAWTG